MFYSLLLAKCLVYGGCVSMEMTTLWLFLVCATRASQHSCEADHVSSDGVGTHADYTAQDYQDSNIGGVPWEIFCTTVFLFENASLVDFQIRKRGHGGDLDENGHFL